MDFGESTELVWLERVMVIGFGECAFKPNEITQNANLDSSELVGSVH